MNKQSHQQCESVYVIAALVDGVAGAPVREQSGRDWPRLGITLTLGADVALSSVPFPFGTCLANSRY